jgi:hypothetical protein
MHTVLLRNNPDIVCLCEAFDNNATNIIRQNLKNAGLRYQYYTGLQGGLFIASKRTILNSTFVQFNSYGCGFDILGRKGFLVVQLESCYIIVLHGQAGDAKKSINIRKDQILEVETYIQCYLAHVKLPILIVGDFNTDIMSATKLFRKQNKWLLPHLRTQQHNIITSFSKSNPLVDRTEPYIDNKYKHMILDWGITLASNPVTQFTMTVSETKGTSLILIRRGLFWFGKMVYTQFLSDHNIVHLAFHT